MVSTCYTIVEGKKNGNVLNSSSSIGCSSRIVVVVVVVPVVPVVPVVHLAAVVVPPDPSPTFRCR